MKQKHRILLASGSPRRRELLTQAGLDFYVQTADVDETPTATEPAAVVEELSRRKAEAVYRLQEIPDRQETVVVAADTIVAMDGEILGKPKDAEDAVRMLRRLSGRTHQVFTGVTVIPMGDARSHRHGEKQGEREGITFSVGTRVTFYELTEEDIRDYVASGEPMDKAGAYGIQGLGARLVERIEGDYNNVVGFPLAHFLRILTEMGELSYGYVEG